MVLLSEKRLTKKINSSHERVLRITCLKIFLLEKDNSVSIGHKILRVLNWYAVNIFSTILNHNFASKAKSLCNSVRSKSWNINLAHNDIETLSYLGPNGLQLIDPVDFAKNI